MKRNKELRKFMKDLKRKSSFRSIIENARKAQGNGVELEKTLKRKEERMKDCINCKYSKKCSDEMEDQHWYHTYPSLVFGRPYTFKLCTYIFSHAFREAFPNLTEKM